MDSNTFQAFLGLLGPWITRQDTRFWDYIPPKKVLALGIYLRWPTTVTAKSFSSRQNHFGHGKIFFVTAKSFWPRQNHFGRGKIFFVTAKSFWPRQNLFRHGKIILATAKSFSTTAKSFL